MALPVKPLTHPYHPQWPALRKLDGRLAHLYQWAQQTDYDDIWDLCCDHGRLGLHLYQAAKQGRIHLVDQVPSIIEPLQKRYAAYTQHLILQPVPLKSQPINPQHINTPKLAFKTPRTKLSIQCLDAGKIQLPSTNNLIILAGIGGKNAINIIQQLITRHQKNHPQKHRNKENRAHQDKDKNAVRIDILISPTNHTYKLRQYLNSSPLEAVQESFITEKGKDYEHFFYRLASNARKTAQHSQPAALHTRSNPAGSSIWQPITPQKHRYLNKLIHYHQCCLQNDTSPAARQALQDYQSALAQAFE